MFFQDVELTYGTPCLKMFLIFFFFLPHGSRISLVVSFSIIIVGSYCIKSCCRQSPTHKTHSTTAREFWVRVQGLLFLDNVQRRTGTSPPELSCLFPDAGHQPWGPRLSP